MPHALLLSPDDQAVSAITGVLEEMSVSCERPLDGVSAAHKLNSQSFDLVLVDCENLPAAKLIFDVCRRGKGGANPVPIAIVDGRAGLPTAFRLGAELILTKPVAKDQARSTIRTAVSRVRKEEPVQAEEAAPVPPEERAQAAAVATASQAVKISNSAPLPALDVPPAPPMKAAAAASALTPATPLLKTVSPAKPPAAQDRVTSRPTPPESLSDDPVMAELDRADARPAPPPVPSSYQASRPKSGRPLVLTVILALAGGALYAAWMYQPGFRAIVQPQIDRVLVLAGVVSQHQTAPAPRVPAPIPAQTSAVPAPAPVAAPVSTSPTDAPPPNGVNVAGAPDATPAPAAATEIPASEPASSKKSAAAPASSDGALPGAQTAVILSSKGAEKRLLHHVLPTAPKGVTARELEGTVVLKTLVDATGKVESVHLVEGNPAVADAAIHAVKQWRYRPYMRDGKSLPFQTVVLVDFQRP